MPLLRTVPIMIGLVVVMVYLIHGLSLFGRFHNSRGSFPP
jgi:hypothetical protein